MKPLQAVQTALCVAPHSQSHPPHVVAYGYDAFRLGQAVLSEDAPRLFSALLSQSSMLGSYTRLEFFLRARFPSVDSALIV